MPLCKKCRTKIENPYKYCDQCNDEIAAAQGQLLRRGRVMERRLKEEADASGNLKIYRASEYTQDELRRLIPPR